MMGLPSSRDSGNMRAGVVRATGQEMLRWIVAIHLIETKIKVRGRGPIQYEYILGNSVNKILH